MIQRSSPLDPIPPQYPVIFRTTSPCWSKWWICINETKSVHVTFAAVTARPSASMEVQFQGATTVSTLVSTWIDGWSGDSTHPKTTSSLLLVQKAIIKPVWCSGSYYEDQLEILTWKAYKARSFAQLSTVLGMCLTPSSERTWGSCNSSSNVP